MPCPLTFVILLLSRVKSHVRVSLVFTFRSCCLANSTLIVQESPKAICDIGLRSQKSDNCSENKMNNDVVSVIEGTLRKRIHVSSWCQLVDSIQYKY